MRNPKDAYIRSIVYHENCNKSGTLESGDGTRQMIGFSLSIVKQFCPWVERFLFRDASSKTCNTGTEIRLAYMYIALYGKTWYERHFGAKLLDREDTYIHLLKKLKSKRFKSASKYEIFSRAFGIKFDPDVKKMFEDSGTFREFFISLSTQFSKEKTCNLLIGWIERFIDDIVFENQGIIDGTWFIDGIESKGYVLSEIPDEEYFQKGGVEFLSNSVRLDRLL